MSDVKKRSRIIHSRKCHEGESWCGDHDRMNKQINLMQAQFKHQVLHSCLGPFRSAANCGYGGSRRVRLLPLRSVTFLAVGHRIWCRWGVRAKGRWKGSRIWRLDWGMVMNQREVKNSTSTYLPILFPSCPTKVPRIVGKPMRWRNERTY